MAAAFVQASTPGTFNNTNGSAAGSAFGSNIASGSAIAVWIAWTGDTETISSLVDSLGNIYTLLLNPTTVGTTGRAALAYCLNSTAGANTLTVTFTGLVYGFITAHEYSGVATASAEDQKVINGQSAPGTATDALTSTAKTTTTSGEVIFGGTVEFSFGIAHCSAGTGFTPRTTPNDNGITGVTEDLIQGAGASIAATFTTNDGTFDYLTGLLTLKPAGAAATPFVTSIGAQLIPRGKPNYSAFCCFVAGTALTLSQIANPAPFAQTQWPLPAPRPTAPIAALTHTQARPQFYQDIKPFAQNSWPLPRVPDTLLSVTMATRPTVDAPPVATPTSQLDWRVPLAKPAAIALLTWTQERKPYYTDIQPFRQSAWPPGVALRPMPGLTTITQDPNQGPLNLPLITVPVGQASLAVPPSRPMPNIGFTKGFTVYEAFLPPTNPLVQTDWPVPQPRQPEPMTKRTHINYFVIDETPPIKGWTDLNPVRRVFPIALGTWLQAKPTYLVSVTLPTGHQQDWPIPAPRPSALNLRTWTQSLTTSTLGLTVSAPFVPREWPLPRRGPSAIGLRTWTQNLIASTLAPAGWALLIGGQRNHLVREIT